MDEGTAVYLLPWLESPPFTHLPHKKDKTGPILWSEENFTHSQESEGHHGVTHGIISKFQPRLPHNLQNKKQNKFDQKNKLSQQPREPQISQMAHLLVC